MKLTKGNVFLILSSLCCLYSIKSVFGFFWTAMQGYSPSTDDVTPIVSAMFFGIILGIAILVVLFKEYKKNSENDNLISFVVKCVKRENGVDLFKLIISFALSLLPLAIIGAFYIFAGSNAGRNQSKSQSQVKNSAGNNSSNTSNNKPQNVAQQASANNNVAYLSREEIDEASRKADNKIEKLHEPKYKEFIDACKANPGASDEELAAELHLSEDTVRAYRPRELSRKEIDEAARNSDNNIEKLDDNKYRSLSNACNANPGASDKQLATDLHLNEETVRAYRKKRYTVEDIRKASGSANNTIRALDDAKYKELVMAVKHNPGANDAELAAKLVLNEETVRAYKYTL